MFDGCFKIHVLLTLTSAEHMGCIFEHGLGLGCEVCSMTSVDLYNTVPAENHVILVVVAKSFERCEFMYINLC